MALSRFEEWKHWVNLTSAQLSAYLNMYGHTASDKGRASAQAILRMQERARTGQPWTVADWRWAEKQVNFLKRMSANTGPLVDGNGEPTRLLHALLVWGHDPGYGLYIRKLLQGKNVKMKPDRADFHLCVLRRRAMRDAKALVDQHGKGLRRLRPGLAKTPFFILLWKTHPRWRMANNAAYWVMESNNARSTQK